jgi:hypothetical protein
VRHLSKGQPCCQPDHHFLQAGAQSSGQQAQRLVEGEATGAADLAHQVLALQAELLIAWQREPPHLPAARLTPSATRWTGRPLNPGCYRRRQTLPSLPPQTVQPFLDGLFDLGPPSLGVLPLPLLQLLKEVTRSLFLMLPLPVVILSHRVLLLTVSG